MSQPKRDAFLDMSRGFALIFMLVDHIAPNILTELTPKNFGFSDMAEVFIFVSGVSCGIVYSRRYLAWGFLSCQLKAMRRIGQIYVAYLSTMFILKMFGGQEHGHADYSGSAYSVTPDFKQTILMNHTYSDLGILLLYMILLLFTPGVIFLCARNKTLVLAGSVLLYALTQIPGLQNVLVLRYEGLFLEPAAWQVLFFIGLVAGTYKDRYDWPPSQFRVVFWLSLLIIESSFLAKVLWWGTTIPYTDKATLAPLRLIHLLAVATVAGSISRKKCQELASSMTALRVICELGRNALFAFCTGEIIAIVSVQLLRLAGYRVSAQIVVTITAVLFNCVFVLTYGEFRKSRNTDKLFPETRGGQRPARAVRGL